MSEVVGREAFAGRVGDTLDADPGAGSEVALTVVRVEDYGPTPGERFSLFLQGPADQPLGQGIHRVSGDGLDPLDLFLVPVRRDGDRLEYEAAFNRLEVTPPQ